MAIKANESHKKIIEITLWMLDRMLCKFERWVSHQEDHSILYEEINSLTQEQCKEIADEIKECRVLLTNLRDELELQKHSEPLNRVISAMSTIFAADDLVSITGRKIEAYGKASSDLTDFLEIKITELAGRLQNISSIALQCKR